MLLLTLILSAVITVNSVHLKYVLRRLDCNITDDLVQANVHGKVYPFIFNYLFMHTGILQLFTKSLIRKDDIESVNHCKMLVHLKGPLITKMKVNFEKIKTLFDWKQDEIDLIKDHIGYAQTLFNEMNATLRRDTTADTWNFVRPGRETAKGTIY